MASPNLGYGNRSEVNIDAYNQWQRSQPWYQQLIRSFGQDPNNVHLSDNQKQQVIKAAQANGVVVDEGGDGQEVDDSGNFRAKGHKLRNTLIVGGIAGAALLTAGLAGAFGGAAAGGAGGAEAAGAGAGLAGIEGGAYGLGDAALAGLGSGAMGAGGAAGAAGAGLGAWDAAGNFIGDSTVSGLAGGSTLDKILGSASAIGGLLGANETGRAQGRLAETQANSGWNRDQIGLYSNQIQANNAENNWNLGAADRDLAQRKFALAAPGERAGNAVRGDILSSARDVAFSGLPNDIPNIQISGGLRPSMFSDSTRQLGALMSKDALAGQQKGDAFAPLTYKPGPTAPTLTPPTNAGTLDDILNAAGTFSDLYGVARPWLKPKGF